MLNSKHISMLVLLTCCPLFFPRPHQHSGPTNIAPVDTVHREIHVQIARGGKKKSPSSLQDMFVDKQRHNSYKQTKALYIRAEAVKNERRSH